MTFKTYTFIALFAITPAIQAKINAQTLNEAKIEITGLAEFEYSREILALDGRNHDFKLSTFEIAAATEIDENLSFSLLFLYEQDENDNHFAIDESAINIQTTDEKYQLSIGRIYVPFGVYETAAISAPAGSNLGETQDEVALLNINLANNFTAGLWHNNKNNDDKNSGFMLAYEHTNFAAGIDWINKLTAANHKSAVAIHGKYAWDNWAFIAEYIAEYAGIDKPKSTQIEVDYAVQDWILAIAYNKIDDFGDYDSTITAATEYAVADNIGLAFEYKTQARADNTGDDNVSTLRFAYAF